MKAERISVVMDLMAQLGIKDRITPMPETGWTRELDEHWTFHVSSATPTVFHGVTVPPFHAYLEYNGWPAGLINPFGGTVAAGREANEDALVAALRAAIKGA